MNLTDDQIEQIKEMAAALMPAGEIALLLGLSNTERDKFVEICKNHLNSPIYTAFHNGILQTKFELRKIIIKLAKNGSPAAQPIAEKFLKEHHI